MQLRRLSIVEQAAAKENIVFSGAYWQRTSLASVQAAVSPRPWYVMHEAELWCAGIGLVLLALALLMNKLMSGHPVKDKVPRVVQITISIFGVILLLVAALTYGWTEYKSTHPAQPNNPYGNL